MASAPWWVPTVVDSKVTGYAGPFADETARDAYISAYDGPDSLGTAIKAVSNPNSLVPCEKMRYAASEGDKIAWTDGTITDA
jgi:hypothetical protein